MHASSHALTEKPLKKGLKTPFPEALKLSNNAREHIELSLMLVQEIYGEGMVIVKHGGSPTPEPLGRIISLLPFAVVEGG